jgi:hypothetical protein
LILLTRHFVTVIYGIVQVCFEELRWLLQVVPDLD